MRSLLLSSFAALALTIGCTAPQVHVAGYGEASDPLTGPFRLAAGSDVDAAKLLAARGLIADGAPVLVTAARSNRPAKVGVCATPDATAKDGCADWRGSPRTGWHPFSPASDERLTLAFTEVATGKPVYRVEAVLGAKGKPAADTTELLVSAALACSGCVGGRVIAAPH